jgi:chemotaxis protein histidine kinase CheA
VCNIFSNLVSPSSNTLTSTNHTNVDSILIQQVANTEANKILNEICTNFKDSYSICFSYHSVEYKDATWVTSHKSLALLPNGVVTNVCTTNTYSLLDFTFEKMDLYDVIETNIDDYNCAITCDVQDSNNPTIVSHMTLDKQKYTLECHLSDLNSEELICWPSQCTIETTPGNNLIKGTNWTSSQESARLWSIFKKKFTEFIMRDFLNNVSFQNNEKYNDKCEIDEDALNNNEEANEKKSQKIEEILEIVEQETLEIVEKEASETVEKEASETVEKEASETVEKEASETVEQEASETVEQEASETVEQEASETVEQEASETKENMVETDNKSDVKEVIEDKNEDKNFTIVENKDSETTQDLMSTNNSIEDLSKQFQNVTESTSNLQSLTSEYQLKVNIPESVSEAETLFVKLEAYKDIVQSKFGSVYKDKFSEIIEEITTNQPYTVLLSSMSRTQIVHGVFPPQVLISLMNSPGVVNLPTIYNDTVRLYGDQNTPRVGKTKIDISMPLYIENMIVYKEKKADSVVQSAEIKSVSNGRGAVSKLNRQIELNRLMRHK